MKNTDDYNGPEGIARFATKDGMWWIAPSHTQKWEEHTYHKRESAIEALELIYAMQVAEFLKRSGGEILNIRHRLDSLQYSDASQ